MQFENAFSPIEIFKIWLKKCFSHFHVWYIKAQDFAKDCMIKNCIKRPIQSVVIRIVLTKMQHLNHQLLASESNFYTLGSELTFLQISVLTTGAPSKFVVLQSITIRSDGVCFVDCCR